MWCPKCRMEYQKGVTVCADCGTDLVEGSEEEFDIVDICSLKDEKMADKFLEYLTYSKLKGARKLFDEESGIYTVAVPTKLEKKAEKLFDGFMMAMEEVQEEEKRRQEEAQQEIPLEEESEESDEEPSSSEDEKPERTSEEYDWDAEEEEDSAKADPFEPEDVGDILTEGELDDIPREMLYHSSQEYVKKEEEYKDLKYSGLTFIIFSILGWTYLILCKLDVLPIQYNPVVFAGICIMFLCFCIIGISSFVKSSKAKSLIPEEQEKIETVTKWMDENLTDEIIDSWRDSKVSEEENDLLIMAHIRRSLTKQFPEENVAFLDMLSEEFYDGLSEKE